MNTYNTVNRVNDEDEDEDEEEDYLNAEAFTCHQSTDDDSDDYENGSVHWGFEMNFAWIMSQEN